MMEPFKATHEILTPAGEKIPVQLVSQKESVKYRVLTAEQWPDPSIALYEWHPSEGVSYRGIHLEGLTINELEVPKVITHSASTSLAASSTSPTPSPQQELIPSKNCLATVIFIQLHILTNPLHYSKSQEFLK